MSMKAISSLAEVVERLTNVLKAYILIATAKPIKSNRTTESYFAPRPFVATATIIRKQSVYIKVTCFPRILDQVITIT